MLLGQEVADGRRRSTGVRPWPPPTMTSKPTSPASLRMHAQADVVHLHRGAVMGRAGYRDLELARQEGEFRMEGRPLADDLAPDARILDLVGGHAGEVIGGDIADAIAAGLDGMHLDARPARARMSARLDQLDPVELQVLAGGEMAVALS